MIREILANEEVIFFVAFFGGLYKMRLLGGNEIGKLLGRKGTLLEGVGVLDSRLSKLPSLSLSGAAVLGNCLYEM